MPYGHVYTLKHEAAISTAITFLQLKAGAANPFLILAAKLTQRLSITSAAASIGLVRKTGAATVTTAVVGTHVFKHRTDDPTPSLSLGTAATGVIGTSEGTDGDVLWKDGLNVLTGWEKIWLPEDRPYVPAGGIIALKFLDAPASHTWLGELTIQEL